MSECRFIISIFLLVMACSCEQSEKKLFNKKSESSTGINFRNLLQEEHKDFNILTYPYFYNGGGVAIGDINNDGLLDICFTGNMVRNRLFLNKGNLKFEDITDKAGIAEKEGWCTGITMADVNGDGFQDIYICRSGLSNAAYRANLLFINNGNQTFTESAESFGLDDAGYSTQASFIDYDHDGDLDMVLANQSKPEYARGGIEYLQLRAKKADSIYANKIFRNDAGHFTNVTAAAGFTSNVLSFSLGLSTADINGDGWSDIYIGNDFKEPDYLFINNRDGTFTDQLQSSVAHTSLYAMGVDVADYNNDNLPDIVELDMLAEGNYAQKMHMGIDGFDQYNPLFLRGMPFQYMKNSLQKNNGDGSFSEIGQLAGVSNTDWSWAPLLADFDNDGLKDLFISNGYKRDNTDIQFIMYSMNESARLQSAGGAVGVAEYISHMPSIKLPNYVYKNKGNDQFENKIKDWGLEEATLSQGAVYADLDNDGDLDLVINNTDEYAGIYENKMNEDTAAHFIRIKIEGEKNNSLGYGAKCFVYTGHTVQYQEQNPVRGYCSSVSPVLCFGTGKNEIIDSIRVVWAGGKTELLKNIVTGKEITVTEKSSQIFWNFHYSSPPTYLTEDSTVLKFRHEENEFNDFTVQSLLPSYLSREGPCMATADVNADGLADAFVGGAKGQAGSIFLQNASANFTAKDNNIFLQSAESEDVTTLFFDADGDGDSDLFVGSGGYEFASDDPALTDRLYLNDGKGNFSISSGLPPWKASTGAAAALDVNGDGFVDLFVGARCVPGQYPKIPGSKIFLNNGKGIFTDGTTTMLPAGSMLGMVTDAAAFDADGDGKNDLLIVGEWISPLLFCTRERKLINVSNTYLKNIGSGFWNKIAAADFDNDGKMDIILGNQGLNNQFRASITQPMTMISKDFDGNGTIDPFLFYYIRDTAFPAYSRDDVTQQVPIFNKKFIYYNAFANVNMQTMFTKNDLEKSSAMHVNTLETTLLRNNGKAFDKVVLPYETQQAPVHAIAVTDVNGDGFSDIILAGNNLHTRIKFGRYDASYGQLFLGNGKGGFTYVAQWNSGLQVRGMVRSLQVAGSNILFGINDGSVKCYKIPAKK